MPRQHTGYIPRLFFFLSFLFFLINAIAWGRNNQTKERKEKHQLQKVLTLTVDTKSLKLIGNAPKSLL